MGRISKVGDAMARTALFEAAKPRGVTRARVALARKLAVVRHRMWVDSTDFRWRKAAAESLPSRVKRNNGGHCSSKTTSRRRDADRVKPHMWGAAGRQSGPRAP